MSKNNIYADADKHLEAMKKEIATLFIRFLAMGFDELNILGTTILTKRLYDELIAINKKHYLEVAVKSYRMAEGKKEISEEWLEDELLAYHYSTGFLYFDEAERKRLRMCEEILTAREFLDFARKDKAVRKSQSLWWMQTYQYMLDITDSARLQAFRDCGVTEVIWHTEEDERVCDECYPRDGQIFSIDDIPPKPHRNCRCWLEPKI